MRQNNTLGCNSIVSPVIKLINHFTNADVLIVSITTFISKYLNNMKRILCFILFCAGYLHCAAQVQDTGLLAHSNKWKVKLHRGMFGMAKPEFGPYSTQDLQKLDSPVLRKRMKDGSYAGASFSSDGWDWDFSKYQTVEKRKAYSSVVTSGTDTAELLFSIYRISNEKKLTFLGEVMSKNDEGKNQVLGVKTFVSGIGATNYDSLPWRFFIQDSTGTKEESVPAQAPQFTGGYIITSDDSLFTEPILGHMGNPGSKFFMEWQSGILVNGMNDRHIAALKFGTPGDLSNPFLVWIRNDIAPSKQHAIASVFALMISAKTK